MRPALVVGGWCKAFDTRAIDGFIDGLAAGTIRLARGNGRFDNGVIDGAVNLLARVVSATGAWLRGAQTGFIRSYVLFLVLAAIGLFAALTAFVNLATAK